jgi:Zn finger protein HypA/HybF involved in hydrogenase expression
MNAKETHVGQTRNAPIKTVRIHALAPRVIKVHRVTVLIGMNVQITHTTVMLKLNAPTTMVHSHASVIQVILVMGRCVPRAMLLMPSALCWLMEPCHARVMKIISKKVAIRLFVRKESVV